ncbi:uncharacterized protein LOC131042307 isoform X3 [Cryptomeria japonica]|uniref:uncharacterized protein LOC131042307 isoform X3 n=1 Tax=Cryptomeria japonica TaxID=3369 RepID=UPI0027DA3F6A|nr:uncharacterized protein LOC131042307 isoform X3 [Cryptomeria japonica]
MEPMDDPASIAAAASNFASYPGPVTDAAAKEFLDSYPLPLLFSALESEYEVPGLEASVVSCLERIFKTSYGASLLPQCMPYAKAGLIANSSLTRRLACKAVEHFLENSDKDEGIGVHAIAENGLLTSIITCLADGDDNVAKAATEAVKNLAKSTRGLELLFPSKEGEIMHLKQLAMNCSSLFAATPNGAKYLLTKNTLHRLAATISNSSVDSMLRSRAMMICARLLSLDSVYSAVDELDVKNVIQAIDMNLELLKFTESNECEIALNSLGQIGLVMQGAELLLCSAPPTARHVIDAAFSRQGRNIQMAGTHALADISGVERSQSTLLLNDQAESCLRNLIYTAAENSSMRSPSNLFWSLLQQEPEVRLAVYRLIAGLVTRPWCLWEVCSKQEIINFVTNPFSETTKEGMEFRHSCCVAINNSLMASDYKNDAAFSQVAEKLQVAIKSGPYLAKVRTESTPLVITQERF